MRVRFAKYEGLGNDFVVIDAESERDLTLQRAAEICDRRYGVGADGVILVLPGPRMRVINADGSIPEMCGNGIRCVALHLARGKEATSLEVGIETDAGPRLCKLEMTGANEANVSVDMGEVRATGTVSLDIDGERVDVFTADAGNPHAIMFGEVTRERAERLGPRIATHAHFKNGTNVEIAHVGTDGIDVIVWERGVGLTLACGTGACAVAAVAREQKLATAGTIRVRLPGGALDIEPGHRTTMRGPARFVYEGILAGGRR